ncbi:isoprenoid biosynthesis glyoxalase ElbB [Neisseria sp. Ec49-e6-T10]|uniref:isoprenoid biosynthesis glyoxalase ElbB n=1 Tax=Neisseria sp. Ec49-e6-T10 TaxID=3140744 RepID=UPI003EBA3F1A
MHQIDLKRAPLITDNRYHKSDERTILVESARLARGRIESLAKLYTTKYEAIVLAGGFGTVKNFTDFFTKGINARLLPDIAKVLKEALVQKKPIVGVCAAPLLLAMAVKEFGQTGQQITFGTRAQSMDFLNILNNWGVEHIEKPINQCHIDTKYRLVTATAYMYENASAAEVFSSIQAAIERLNNLLK